MAIKKVGLSKLKTLPDISHHKNSVGSPAIALIFAALGDDTRLAIINRLQDGSDQSISALSQGFSLTRQGVSRHLNVLQDAGLVDCHRIGRETRYHLKREALDYAQSYLVRASRQWDDAIARLAKHIQS